MSAQVRGRRQRHAAQGEVRESCRFRVRLRPEALSRSSRSPAKFREGDKVEARLSGQSKWSKAKVRRVRDDTYDLEFDDGEREKRVKPKYIRKRGGSRSRSRGAGAAARAAEAPGGRQM